MDSLDCKYYEPDLLDVKYDDRTNQNYDQNLETAAPSSEELDQELESLLLLMGESNTGRQDESTPVYDDVVDPTIEVREWLNADELVDPKEFNYQVPNPCRGRFDYSVSHNNNYNYQANSSSYNYSPSDRNNCNYQADHSSSKFDYQSDQDSSSKFSHVPTANNARFDYQFTNPTKFNRSIPTVNRHPSVPCNNNSSQSRDQSILDVEVDQNTRVRLEVGVSAEVGNGYARASAYAKATIYRRG